MCYSQNTHTFFLNPYTICDSHVKGSEQRVNSTCSATKAGDENYYFLFSWNKSIERMHCAGVEWEENLHCCCCQDANPAFSILYIV